MKTSPQKSDALQAMSVNQILVATGVASLLLSIGAAVVVPQFRDVSSETRSGVLLYHRMANQQLARSQIALYYWNHKERYPWSPGEVAETQWSVFGPLRIARNAAQISIETVPINPLSPPEVASLIVEVTDAGDHGTDIDATRAGWVWNSTDNDIWPTDPKGGLEAWKRATDRSLADYFNPTPFQMIVGGVSILVAMLFLANQRRANQAIVERLGRRP